MDEGINSYTEVKVMDSLYGAAGSLLDVWGATAGESGAQRLFYLSQPDTDPMARFAYQYMNMGAYGDITYGKTATVLLTLDGLIGQDAMRQAMHTYFTLPLHPAHGGGFSQDHRRGIGPKPALVFRSG